MRNEGESERRTREDDGETVCVSATFARVARVCTYVRTMATLTLGDRFWRPRAVEIARPAASRRE